LRILLLSHLLPLLLLLLLRQVMADDAARRGADYTVMPGDMSGDAPDDGSLDAALRVRGLRADQECDPNQGCSQRL
jgi:hypothetical protein